MSKNHIHTGDRVAVTCHQVHTTYGGLTEDSHIHTGTVSTVSVKGNVWVYFDDDAGPAVLRHPDSLNLVEGAS